MTESRTRTAIAVRPNALDEWVYGTTAEPDVRFTLANERTFLAWIRTALACLAIVVAVEALDVIDQPVLHGALCLMIALLAVTAAIHGWWSWIRTERAIRREEPLPRRRAPLTLVVVVVGIVVLIAGAAIW